MPVDGLVIPEGQTIPIEGHAASPGGVSKIEIWVNGEFQFEISNPPSSANLTSFSQLWTPPGEGEYTIQVLALSEDGSASEPDNARVRVGVPLHDDQPAPEEQAPAPEGDLPTLPYTATNTQTATPTSTPTSPPDVVIEFWADPGEISAGELITVSGTSRMLAR